MSFVLILYFDWLLGPHKGQNFEKKKKNIFSSEAVKWMNPEILCGASMGRENESLVAKSRSHDQDGHHAHIC